MIHLKPFRFGRAEVVLILALIALTALVFSIGYVPAIADGYARLTHQWTDWAIRVGYLGALMASFVGSLSVIIIFPYTIIVFFLATQGLNPFWLGVLMGTGAFLGQLSGYVLGLFGTRPLKTKKPETYDALERIVHYRPRAVQFLLLLFAATPLPDDVLMVPLGMLRYSIWQIIPPTWIGKVIAGLVVTYTGSLFVNLDTRSATSPGAIISQLGSFYSLALLLYAIVKVDWTKTMHRLLDHPAIRGRQELLS